MAFIVNHVGASCSTARFIQNVSHFLQEHSSSIWLWEYLKYLKSLLLRSICKPLVIKKPPEH